MICMVFWRVWFQCNGSVHESASLHVGEIVPWAAHFLNDFRIANGSEVGRNPYLLRASSNWQALVAGFFKVNTDAAGGKVGIIIIVRNSNCHPSTSQECTPAIPRLFQMFSPATTPSHATLFTTTSSQLSRNSLDNSHDSNTAISGHSVASSNFDVSLTNEYQMPPHVQ
ncbi:hypothetical protein LWI28_020214 [Acer negundo]|uniref:Uncharacterized protein n=1 Tax=Acer negundo TaxID=4023 RepID=A0AAD5NFU6_ACENE|nr:hypothetical protein LWI28_020214 [Acer negundo]